MAVKKLTFTSLQGIPNSPFNLTVDLLDSNDVPITNNSSIYQGQQFTRPNNSVPFTLDYLIGNTNLNIPNVKFLVKYGSRILYTSALFNLVALCDPAVETAITPNWLTNLGFTFDTASHNFKLLTQGDSSIELKLESILPPQPTGITSGNNAWNNTIYIPGVTSNTNGFNKEFVFNPTVSSSGGVVVNNKYRLRVRRASTPSDVFYIDFTTPSVSSPTPTIVALPVSKPNCTVPPTITQLVSTIAAQIVYRFNGEGVASQLVEIIDGANNVIKSKILNITVGGTLSGAPIFEPTFQPTWVYDTPLNPGTYRLRIKGNNCESGYSTSAPFTIAVPVTTTLAPTTTLSGVTTTLPVTTTVPPSTNTFMPIKMFGTPPDIINIVATGYNGAQSGDWLLNDLSTIPVDSDKEWKYNINGFVVRTKTPLTNYRYRSNNPVHIYKSGMLTGLQDGDYKWSTPGENTYIPGFSIPNAGQTYSRGVPGGYMAIGFKRN